MKKGALFLVLTLASVFAFGDFSSAVLYERMTVAGGKSGGQRIDIDYSPNGGTIIRAKYAPTVVDDNQCLYCARNTSKTRNSDNPDFSFFVIVEKKLRFDYYDKTVAGSKQPTVNQVYELVVSNGVAQVFNADTGTLFEQAVYAAKTFEPKFPMYLFSSYELSKGSPGNFGNSAVLDFYYLEIYEIENGVEVLKRRYVPCKDGDTVTVADTVEGRVYTPTPASGSFSVSEEDRLAQDDKLQITGVPSAFGEAEPAYGQVTGLLAGEERTVRAPAVWTNETEDVAATCTGWKLYAYDRANNSWNFVSEGSENEFTYAHPNPAAQQKLEWQYAVEYKVSATGAEGSAFTGTGWYEAGAEARIGVTSPEGLVFTGWTAEGGTCGQFDNPTRVVVSGPVALTANFTGRIKYVAEDGDDEANGGATLATAYAHIAHAVEQLGEEGGVVYVAAGTYVETNASSAVSISNAVAVIGMTGNPNDVIVTRTTNADKRIFDLKHPDARLQYLTVKNGKANYGGGVRINPAGGTVEDCVLTGCSNSGYNGGGGNLRMEGGRVSRCVISKGTGSTNNGGDKGGGVWMNGGVLENSLITQNTGGGAGVYMAGPAKLVNCTIVSNYVNSTTYSAGVQLSKDTASVVNCIISGNQNSSDTSLGGLVAKGSLECFVNCASEDGLINDKCLMGNVAFGDSARSDYTLGAASICKDAGADYETSGAVSATDLAGAARVLGPAVDIGCYELRQDLLSVDFDSDVQQGFLPTRVTFTATAFNAGPDAVFAWDFDGDGRTDLETSETVAVWAYQAAGLFDVSVTLTSGGESVQSAKTGLIRIAPAELYADAGNAEGAAFPYATPATAATNIQDAVDAAINGCLIHVLAGADGCATYSSKAQLNVKKGVSIVGEGASPTNILIRGTNGARALSANAAGASFANLSFSGDSKGNGKSVFVEGDGASFSNCVFFAGTNTGSDYGAGSGCLYGANVFVTHCEFLGKCYASLGDNGRNGAAANFQKGSRVENSLFHDLVGTLSEGNGGPNGCTVKVANSALVNCTLVRCTNSTVNAVGIWTEGADAQVVNCAVVECRQTTKLYDYVDNDDGTITTNYIGNAYNLAPWGGVAAAFDHCATDAETAPSESCITVTTEAFRDYGLSDYRPAPGGPLANAGRRDVILSSEIDFVGKPRLQGRAIDIGCYESAAAGFVLYLR